MSVLAHVWTAVTLLLFSLFLVRLCYVVFWPCGVFSGLFVQVLARIAGLLWGGLLLVMPGRAVDRIRSLVGCSMVCCCPLLPFNSPGLI